MYRNEISRSKISEYSFQATLLILFIAMPASLLLRSLLKNLFPTSNDELITIGAATIAFGFTSFILLKKLFGAIAFDATQKGITEDLQQKHNQKQ